MTCPMELQQFTTRYNAHQDRLSIEGQSTEGEAICLWLTYRMMRQLVPLVVKLSIPVADAEDKAMTLAAWALSSASVANSPENKTAPASINHTPGTNTLPVCSCLISAIEVKSTPKQAVLRFRIGSNKEVAVIDFKPEHLRQWLGIVHRLWNEAGWPTTVWPQWVKAAETPVAPVGSVWH